MTKSKNTIKLNPLQILILGYLLVTICGAILLSLPVSSSKATGQPFIDAMFLATSGISTSGLTVIDIGKDYSIFGQIVLMCIFQIGGIGYMTFVIFTSYMLGIKFSITTSIIAKESIATDSFNMLGKFFKNVLLYTMIFEFAGAVVLTAFWMKEFDLLHAAYLGIFHSVSAFCTAGFSTFSNNFMSYSTSTTLNMSINIISIIGGLGFFVLIDLYNLVYKKSKNIYPRKLTVHSKMVILVTGIVMLSGAIIIFLSEKWPVEMQVSERIMVSFFQSISASTTDGFNSIDIGAMSTTGLTMLMFLMFVGASPGSTGGGMKTTTLATLFIAVKSYLQGKKEVNIIGKEIPQKSVLKALVVFSIFVLILLIDMLVLSYTEDVSYIRILFETVSALGNTGLSTGITSNLSFVGKIVLILTMFIGRVGPLTLGIALLKKHDPALYRYPQEDIFIG
ncbi:MAG: Ktr system potassium uptake protein B [Elusimicrobia bacterium ADurb.Bin231]|nr:MAG: Ktr system potassium uptake protein B [Elusimicrobia bacterium ADurb.Bin231]